MAIAKIVVHIEPDDAAKLFRRVTWAEARAKDLADAWRDAYAGRMTIDVKDWQRMKAALARYDAGPDGGEEEE